MAEGPATKLAKEEFLTMNPDGSVTLDAYAGKTREELKHRCRDLASAVDRWQLAAMFAATGGTNSLDQVPEPYRSKIRKMIEAYSDRQLTT